MEKLGVKELLVHRLQCKTELLTETAELINREWPKSMEHRYTSLLIVIKS